MTVPRRTENGLVHSFVSLIPFISVPVPDWQFLEWPIWSESIFSSLFGITFILLGIDCMFVVLNVFFLFSIKRLCIYSRFSQRWVSKMCWCQSGEQFHSSFAHISPYGDEFYYTKCHLLTDKLCFMASCIGRVYIWILVAASGCPRVDFLYKSICNGCFICQLNTIFLLFNSFLLTSMLFHLEDLELIWGVIETWGNGASTLGHGCHGLQKELKFLKVYIAEVIKF